MNILDLRPASTPEYMTGAWASFILWASKKPSVVARFRIDTGCKYQAPKNPIEAEIDRVTGRDRKFVEDFVRWVNENLWGDPFTGEEERQ